MMRLKWVPFEGPYKYATVIYNYQSNQANHLNVLVGDVVYIVKHNAGWYLGYNSINPRNYGVLPKCHVNLIENNTFPHVSEDLRYWIEPISQLFVNIDDKKFASVERIIEDICDDQRRLHKEKLTGEDLRETQRKLALNIAKGQKLLSLPVTVRNSNFKPIDPLEVTSVQLYKSHVKLQDDIGAGSLANNFLSKDSFSMQVKVSELSCTTLVSGALMEVIAYLISIPAGSSNTTSSNTTSPNYTRVSLNSQQEIRGDSCEFSGFKPFIFTDLYQPSPDSRVFLVFQAIRVGMIDLKKTSQSSKPLTKGVRRPYGVSVFDVTSYFGSTGDVEIKSLATKLYGPINETQEYLDTILGKLLSNSLTNEKSERGNIRIEKISIIPSNYNQLQESPQWRVCPIARSYSIKSDVSWSQNMLHVTLISATTEKGDKIAEKNMEVRISLMDSSGKSYNFDNLSANNKKDYYFTSTVYYHSDNPRYMETFSIKLPNKKSELPPDLHLRFLFKHRSMKEANDLKLKPYGVAYLRIYRDSYEEAACLLPNQSYALKIQKIDDQKKINDLTYLSGPEMYTSQESLKQSRYNFKFMNHNAVKDMLCVETVLCSTVHTNNEYLYKLMNWRQYTDDLINILTRNFINPQFVDDSELKRFSQPVLSALLEILSCSINNQDYLGMNNSSSLFEPVFRALIRYFDFHNLKSVYSENMHAYITHDFKFNNIHNLLLDLLAHELKIRHSVSGGGSQVSQKAFSKISWFFKIIVKSRLFEIDEYSSPTCSDEDRNAKEYQFNVSVDMLMTAICEATDNQSPDSSFLWITVYKHVGDIIDDLLEVYSSENLTNHLLKMLERSSKIVELSKENLLNAIINSKLFSDCTCRSRLLSCVTSNLLKSFCSNFYRFIDKINTGDDNTPLAERFCDYLLNYISRLTDLWKIEIHKPQEEIWCVLIDENLLYTVIKLLIECLHHLKDDNDVHNSITIYGRTLCTVLISLLHEMSRLWPKFVNSCYLAPNYPPIEDFGGNDVKAGPLPACNCAICLGLGLINLYDFVSQILALFLNMCSVGLFPGGGLKACRGQAWIDMLLLQSKEMIDALGEIFELALQPYYMQGKINIRGFPTNGLQPTNDAFSGPLISLFLDTINVFFSQTYFITDDNLVPGRTDCKSDQLWTACELLHRLWQALGAYQTDYIAPFMPPILRMSLLPYKSIREVTVRILFDMIDLDITATEQNVVSELDHVMEQAGEAFVTDMESIMCEELKKPRKSGSQRQMDLVPRLCKQMRVLLEYAHYVNDESKINGMLAINNIRNYYQSIRRDDMYLRYLYKLLKLHKDCANLTERGQTLRVISCQLDWSDASVQCEVSDEYKNCTTQLELKEKICIDSLECLKKRDWELAIEVCSELVYLYREVAPNYEKLSEILDCQAQLYQNIVSKEAENTFRAPYQYYLICYYGEGYPTFISGHRMPSHNEVSFIYRTDEKLGDVMNMLMKQFPGCRILTSQKPKEGSDKQIFVGGVSPVPELPQHLEGKKINSKIRKYYDTNQVKNFTFVRNLNKTDVVTEMRTELSEYEIREPLPGVLSMVPVICSKKSERSPFETAISILKNELNKLRCKLEDYEENDKKESRDFVGSLKGTIDAPVGGGLLSYLELIDLDVDDKNPELTNNNDFILAEIMLKFLELQYQCILSWNHHETEKELKEHLVAKFEENANQLSLKLDFDTSHLDADILRQTIRAKGSNVIYHKQSMSTISYSQQSVTTLQAVNGTMTRSSFRQSNYSQQRDSYHSDTFAGYQIQDMSSMIPTPAAYMLSHGGTGDNTPPQVPKRPENLTVPTFTSTTKVPPTSPPQVTGTPVQAAGPPSQVTGPPLPPRVETPQRPPTTPNQEERAKPPLPPRTPRMHQH